MPARAPHSRPSRSNDRYWPAEEALRRSWLNADDVAWCIDCGTLVGDLDAHDRFHAVIAGDPPPDPSPLYRPATDEASARWPAVALTTGDPGPPRPDSCSDPCATTGTDSR
jgi:hypothetical protein